MSSPELYKGGSPVVKNHPSKALNNIFSFAWLACGIATVVIPLIFRTMKMNNYRNMYYMYNWEEAQQEYQEQQEQYYQQYSENNYAQEYGQGNYQYQWEQMQGSYDINQCKWYQLNCFPYYINENGEPEPSAGWVGFMIRFMRINFLSSRAVQCPTVPIPSFCLVDDHLLTNSLLTITFSN
jgi:hypothetical protein